jgi:tRNA(Arg) A34 adenosine deaminase TadA
MNETDLKFIRLSFEVAREARANGNHPFGALLVDDQGHILLKGENTVITGRDCTGHAEANLIREAFKSYSPEFLARCTIYASTEPCPMCAAAIFWGNVRRVVYGLSTASLNELVGEETPEVFALPCREVFAKGRKQIEVLGPVLEDEACAVHEGFWQQPPVAVPQL